MKVYLALLSSMLTALLLWYNSDSKVLDSTSVGVPPTPGKGGHRSHVFVRKAHLEKRHKSHVYVKKADLVNIMVNLQHGTVVNEIVNRDKMSPRLTRFIQRGREARQRVLQVVKEKESNMTGTAVTVKTAMRSHTLIYNRIYKSGSASFLCKKFLH